MFQQSGDWKSVAWVDTNQLAERLFPQTRWHQPGIYRPPLLAFKQLAPHPSVRSAADWTYCMTEGVLSCWWEGPSSLPWYQQCGLDRSSDSADKLLWFVILSSACCVTSSQPLGRWGVRGYFYSLWFASKGLNKRAKIMKHVEAPTAPHGCQ